jgi:hypothetical protein
VQHCFGLQMYYARTRVSCTGLCYGGLHDHKWKDIAFVISHRIVGRYSYLPALCWYIWCDEYFFFWKFKIVCH